MESLKELYRIGPGPSSSHTLAPQNACKLFMEHFPDVLSFDAELFGSLALTGEGHHTDKIIQETFAPHQCRVTFNPYKQEKFPNGFVLRGYDAFNNLVKEWTVFSLGGGAFDILEENDLHLHDNIYPLESMDEILEYCNNKKISLADYAFEYEPNIESYLSLVFSQMLKTVKNGLESSGLLPGSLKVEKVAKKLYLDAQTKDEKEEKDRLSIIAYAYAACEENASGHICVTSPTMGASGVIASLIYYYYYHVGISRSKLIKALALGGIFGNIVKTKATISGAVGGCQAEVGTACAMGSAMVAYLEGANNNIIAYAAEIGIEHNLGLTCDPVGGYVIIPCIERNAVCALRCLDNAFIAQRVGSHKANKVSFDDVVRTMKYTGNKIPTELKETSLGGLAKEVFFEDEKTIIPKEELIPQSEEVDETEELIPQTEEIIEPEIEANIPQFKEIEKEEDTSELKLSAHDFELLYSWNKKGPISNDPDNTIHDKLLDDLDLKFNR